MLKKTIKYTNWDGVEVEEDFYFNLTKTELIKMQIDEQESLSDKLLKIIKSKNTIEIIKIFESIVLKAYGEKSPDGRRFIKVNDNGVSLAKQFIETPAYDALYFEMITEPEKFAALVNALIPADLAEQVKKMQESGQIPDELKGLIPSAT